MSEFIGRPRSYVGVSGVVSRDIEAKLRHSATKVGLFRTDRMLALGVKATHKTQYEDIENKYGRDWYPVGPDGFSQPLPRPQDRPHTLGVAQAYLEVEHVGDPAYRRNFLSRIALRGANWLQAVQYDMLPWHTDAKVMDVVHQTKERHGLQVLLQCHNPAMESLGPKGVLRKLAPHADSIDYLLFDSSHGTGQRMDAAQLDVFLEEAHSDARFFRTGFAVAGGLNAQNVREDLPPLLAKYEELSWDAEGQLHSVNAEGRRPLDLSVAYEYLMASTEVVTY